MIHPYYTYGGMGCKRSLANLSKILKIFCEIRTISQFFDIFLPHFETAFSNAYGPEQRIIAPGKIFLLPVYAGAPAGSFRGNLCVIMLYYLQNGFLGPFAGL